MDTMKKFFADNAGEERALSWGEFVNVGKGLQALNRFVSICPVHRDYAAGRQCVEGVALLINDNKGNAIYTRVNFAKAHHSGLRTIRFLHHFWKMV